MKLRMSQITVAPLVASLAIFASTSRVAAADRKEKQNATAQPSDNGVVQAAPMMKSVELIPPNSLRLVLEWDVASQPHENWLVFVHFFDANGEAKFNGDFAPDPQTSSWKPGIVVLAPRMLNLPAELTGTFDIRVGLYQKEDAGSRAALIDGMTSKAGRYVLVGQVAIEDGKVEFIPER